MKEDFASPLKPTGSYPPRRRFIQSAAVKRPLGQEEGFTLLETLVAALVLGIALTVIFQLFSGGLDQARRSGDYTRAVWHARAKMEEILLTGPSATGDARGRFEDGYLWRARVAPAEGLAPDRKRARPLAVKVVVSWEAAGGTREVALETIALETREDRG